MHVSVMLERGVIEDLQALLAVRHGRQSRSEVVRRAVQLLLAREALQVIRGHAIDRLRAQREADEQRALSRTREQREQEDEVRLIQAALRIAAVHDTTEDDGCLS